MFASPPAPSGRRGPRGRNRFGAGVLVGVALTGAAIGGYAIGSDSSAGPAPDGNDLVAESVSVDAGVSDVSDLVEAVRPSVVSVHQKVTQEQPSGTLQGVAAGTGFVLSADGYIVTNNHVIAEGTDTVVTFADGSEESAEIVAADPSRDLAVLRVERDDLSPLAVGNSDDLRLGEQLIAVGYALDLNGEPSVTTGVLSATDRSITEENGERLVNLLQTDTAINPGNSGGPLLNSSGEVVGINTAIAGRAQNIGFAIAITPVLDVIDALRDGTVPQRALMGVTTTPPQDADVSGAEIVEIAPGTAASASDLRVGDVVVAVDDSAVDGPDTLGTAIAVHHPDDKITVTVLRDGSTRQIDLTLGAKQD